MSKKQWVCHISGQGEKWEVVDSRSTDHHWNCYSFHHELWLPKSEYRLCDPPEVWRDVTGECRIEDYSNRSGDFLSILHAPTGANVMSKCNDGYRLRKLDLRERTAVPNCVFIVEQKVSQ